MVFVTSAMLFLTYVASKIFKNLYQPEVEQSTPARSTATPLHIIQPLSQQILRSLIQREAATPRHVVPSLLWGFFADTNFSRLAL